MCAFGFTATGRQNVLCVGGKQRGPWAGGCVQRKASWLMFGEVSNTNGHWLGRVPGKIIWRFSGSCWPWSFFRFLTFTKTEKYGSGLPGDVTVHGLSGSIGGLIAPSCGHFSICSKTWPEPSLAGRLNDSDRIVLGDLWEWSWLALHGIQATITCVLAESERKGFEDPWRQSRGGTRAI